MFQCVFTGKIVKKWQNLQSLLRFYSCSASYSERDNLHTNYLFSFQFILSAEFTFSIILSMACSTVKLVPTDFVLWNCHLCDKLFCSAW